VIPNDTDADT